MLLLKVLKETFWPLKLGNIISWIGVISSILVFLQGLDIIPKDKLIQWFDINHLVVPGVILIMGRYFYLLHKEIKAIEKQLGDKNIWGEAISSL